MAGPSATRQASAIPGRARRAPRHGNPGATGSKLDRRDGTHRIFRTRAAAEGVNGGTRKAIGALPPQPRQIRLRPGDRLVLTKGSELGRPAATGADGAVAVPAQIPVALPEFFDSVRAGEPIWFDDGAIDGTIEQICPDEVVVEIVQAEPGGNKLGPEKGINVPETDLLVSALSDDDLAALVFAGQHADMVGVSFGCSQADVRALHQRLHEMGSGIGVVLKIETRPELRQPAASAARVHAARTRWRHDCARRSRGGMRLLAAC